MSKIEYIDTKEFRDFPVIELTDASGVLKIAENANVKFIFRINGENDRSNENVFYFPHNNIIYKITCGRFNTLEDYQSAFEGGFSKAEDFYDALKGNFRTFAEYDFCKKLGTDQRNMYLQARDGGYVKGFPSFVTKYEKYKINNYTKDIPKNIDNAIKLYEFAKSKGFTLYSEFEKVYDAGYPDYLLYKEASDKFFKSASDFYNATKAGFNDSSEYEEAKRFMIGSKREYDSYINFKKNNKKGFSHDEFQTYDILTALENGKQLPLSEMRELLSKEQEKHKRSFNNNDLKILPIWYTKKLDKDDSMCEFLLQNEYVRRLGFYDKEKCYFEIFKPSKRKIYIDASNVAFTNSNENKRTAKFKNIMLVVEELKTHNFNDITAIADATLIHRANDHDVLKELQKIINYKEVPSHTSADEFLISSAKRDKCLIVSNDTFKDWKENNKWMRLNADNIRLPFIISKGKVVFSKIERFFEN